MPYNTITRPLDQCDVCDGLFPLEAITPGIKVLKFVKIYLGKPGHYARVHHGTCHEVWKAQNRGAVLQSTP